ncbi:hypothetical protein FS749_016056 [Ceratobasidium sp. UAMH 11750]|nr:hypothetical protein FS749_016056 [Ceratobasidium sp. UAMH 11750]
MRNITNPTTVISDTPAGIFTLDHLNKLRKLRNLEVQVDTVADEAHACWLLFEENEHKIRRAERYCDSLLSGHTPLNPVPSEFEQERLALLYEEVADSYLHSSEWKEVRDKQAGKEVQAQKLIDEPHTLRRRLKSWGDYGPLVRLSKNWKPSDVSPPRRSPTPGYDSNNVNEPLDISLSDESLDHAPANMSLDRSRADESMDRSSDRSATSSHSHISISDNF